MPLRTAAANIRRAGVAVILSDEAPGATPPTRHPEERSDEPATEGRPPAVGNADRKVGGIDPGIDARGWKLWDPSGLRPSG